MEDAPRRAAPPGGGGRLNDPLEIALAEADEDGRRSLALGLAALGLAPEVIDLEAAAADAAAFVESFPGPSRVTMDVHERAGEWLARRYGTAEARRGLRERLKELAELTPPELPLTRAAYTWLAERQPGADPSSDEVWRAACEAVARGRVRPAAGGPPRSGPA